MKDPAGKQRGVGLVGTIFVLVVLSALAAYMVRLSTVQHVTTAMSIQSARAWYAAVSGLEWAVYRIESGGCPATPSNLDVDGFNVQVEQCDPAVVSEGAGSYRLYRVAVNASRGSLGNPDYVSRDIMAVVRGN